MTRYPQTRRSLGRRILAAALALALTCPIGGGLLPAARAQDVTPPAPPVAPAPASDTSPDSTVRIPTVPPPPGIIKTILLFPFANAVAAGSTSFNADVVGAQVEEAVKMRLNLIGRYKANSFSPTLPQIQRALSEARVEGLSDTDIIPPYNDAAKGQKITATVGTDGYLLGSIEALTVDPTSRNVTLTVSATLYDASTGASVKSLAFTGHGISYNATDQPQALLQGAVNDVAGHIVSALDASSSQPQATAIHYTSPDAVRGRRSNNGSILFGILLATGLGFALSSSHHGGGGGGSTGTGTGTGTGTPGVPNPPVITVPSGGPPAPPNP